MPYYLKRWGYKCKSIIADFVSYIGLVWLFIEIMSHATNGKTDSVTKSVGLFIAISIVLLIIVLFKNKPKTSFLYKLREKDNFIEIKVGDAFANPGSIIIPFNDCFDVSLGGNVKKSNSLQNQLIRRYYSGQDEHLQADISKQINSSLAPHAIGTTIEIEHQDKRFYLLVNSRKKKNNIVESSVDDFCLSLSTVWEYIAKESDRHQYITIPLISTGHASITNLIKHTAIKEIIDSYIESSKSRDIAETLTISIHPDDLYKGIIDLDDIEEYLQLMCKHYKITTFVDKLEGEEISASRVETIKR